MTKYTNRSAFTLIEMLVVIAVTGILLTLVFKPLIDSFNLTSRAGTQIESQTDARNIMRDVTTRLSNASFLFDNAQTPINLWFADGTANHNPYYQTTNFAMFEYVLPARQGEQNPNALIDPTTGLPIVPAGSSQSGLAFPLVQGKLLGRVWVGLFDNTSLPDTHTLNTNANPNDAVQDGMPKTVYGNRFTDPGSATDNRYTLYSAEVQTSILDPDDKTKFIPNLMLFHTVDKNGNIITGDVTAMKAGQIAIHDPNFFYDDSLAGDGSTKWAVPGWRSVHPDGKVRISENWRAVAGSYLPQNRADMVALARDDNGLVISDANGRPTVRTLASFAPAYIENDPGVPTQLENAGNEEPTVASPTYTSQHGHWAIPYRVLVYRASNSNVDPMTLNPLNYYQMGPDGKIFHYNAVPGNTGTLVTNGDVGPQLTTSGTFGSPNTTEFAFAVDADRGRVNFALPSTTVIPDTPFFDGNIDPVSVQRTERIVHGAALYSPKEINDHFDPNAPGGIGQYNSRYLILSTLTNSDTNDTLFGALNPNGLVSPLDPTTHWAQANNFARIVPGSERVYGPDQRPGPHYGKYINYTRVSSTAGTIGLNEYKINYENVRSAADAPATNDPRLAAGYIQFDSQPDSEAALNFGDPAYGSAATTGTGIENPTQAQTNGIGYRPHSLPEATSNAGENMAACPVVVTYSFQMNQPNDVVKIDYLTRDLMSFALEVRLFDQATGTQQSTALTQKIVVRNLQR